MTRAQVEIPEDLYERAMAFSRERETPLADVVRRGLEILLDRYPPVTPSEDDWVFPTFSGGLKVPLEDLKYYARDEEAYRSLPHGDDENNEPS